MKKTIRILALLFALVTVFSLCSCATSSPKSITKAFVTASMKLNFKKADSYLLVNTETSLNYYAEKQGLTFKEFLVDKFDVNSIDEYFKEIDDEIKDNMDDVFGKYKFEIRKLTVNEYSAKELKKFKESSDLLFAAEMYDIDIDEISAAADVAVKVRINGEDKGETISNTVTVVKYKGQWKVASNSAFSDIFDH